MSVNKDRPHVFLIPEDDANRQIANGFRLEFGNRQFHVEPVAGGWREVLLRFSSDHVNEMSRYPERLMILLLDFDRKFERRDEAKGHIPDQLMDRVFVLGVWNEPEDFKHANLGSLETIGRRLARDCRDNTKEVWRHEFLGHNAEELARLCGRMRAIQ